ncbi:hypothetical protein PsorP6_004073 [Peronosclerospora sorghi]|uniref:Uncharacterized protein n=1 Tax=Peronosclerospora sorghi TaxID=230839 RepID=A0ACC0VLM9_9STRA|nr:hypothetical protein PsorP6_004073 [Peronosclerospora sorghi]
MLMYPIVYISEFDGLQSIPDQQRRPTPSELSFGNVGKVPAGPLAADVPVEAGLLAADVPDAAESVAAETVAANAPVTANVPTNNDAHRNVPHKIWRYCVCGGTYEPQDGGIALRDTGSNKCECEYVEIMKGAVKKGVVGQWTNRVPDQKGTHTGHLPLTTGWALLDATCNRLGVTAVKDMSSAIFWFIFRLFSFCSAIKD